MTTTMERHLTTDIAAFIESVGDAPAREEKFGTRDRILALLRENPRHSSKPLSEATGISAKGIEKHLAKLKSQGAIRRIGPNKGGSWEVTGDASELCFRIMKKSVNKGASRFCKLENYR